MFVDGLVTVTAPDDVLAFWMMMSRRVPDAAGRVAAVAAVRPEKITSRVATTAASPAARTTSVALRPLIWFKASLRTLDEPVVVGSKTGNKSSPDTVVTGARVGRSSRVGIVLGWLC